MQVAEGTVVLYSDVVCGWATIALSRFYRERERLGLQDAVRVDHRLFSLEDINQFPVPKRYLEGEVPVLGTIEPDFGFRVWQQDTAEWPVTSLLANEAVHAAKSQSPQAAEELDLSLRKAFFSDSVCISLQHEILRHAHDCPSVDADRLAADLDAGNAREAMMRDYRANKDNVQGSPHFFFSDGGDVHNPGIELHWQGDPGAGFPVVDSDDHSVYESLLKRAAGRD